MVTGLCPFELYLAAVMDAYSKRIVGYAVSDTMKTDLVIQALRMATRQRRISKGLIYHSDKGSQGGFKRSSQHLDGGKVWDDRGVGVRRKRAGRRCGRRDIQD